MTSKLNRVVFLATGNIHKFLEARQILSEQKIATAMLRKVHTIEIQDDNIENIAKARVDDAFKKCMLPIAVEDAGLFIEAFANFPGPYSSYVFKTIGNSGILKLMENTQNRKAYFRSVVAFKSSRDETPTCFSGVAEGRITREERGTRGFGFDPIFEPIHSIKTFSQMTTEEKNQISHRATSFRKLAKFFTDKFET